MKQTFLILAFTLLQYINVNAQTELYEGIYSGMTDTEYVNHCRSHTSTFSQVKNEYLMFYTRFEGETYIMWADFDANRLHSVHFSLNKTFYGYDYNDGLKDIATDLQDVFRFKYGEPIGRNWPSRYKIGVGQIEPILRYKKGSIETIVYIEKIIPEGKFTEVYKIYFNTFDAKYVIMMK